MTANRPGDLSWPLVCALLLHRYGPHLGSSGIVDIGVGNDEIALGIAVLDSGRMVLPLVSVSWNDAGVPTGVSAKVWLLDAAGSPMTTDALSLTQGVLDERWDRKHVRITGDERTPAARRPVTRGAPASRRPWTRGPARSRAERLLRHLVRSPKLS